MLEAVNLNVIFRSERWWFHPLEIAIHSWRPLLQPSYPRGINPGLLGLLGYHASRSNIVLVPATIFHACAFCIDFALKLRNSVLFMLIYLKIEEQLAKAGVRLATVTWFFANHCDYESKFWLECFLLCGRCSTLLCRSSQLTVPSCSLMSSQYMFKNQLYLILRL